MSRPPHLELVDADEAALISAAGRGDAAAFSSLYARYYPLVARRLAHLIGPEPATIDDLAQDTFVRALRTLSSYRGECPFRHWLLRLAMSIARDEQRRTRRSIWRLFTKADALERLDLPSAATPDHAELRAVHAALATLSVKLREVVVLFELEGETLAEIAAQLEISIHTAGSRLRRGREQLRAALERAGYGELRHSPVVLFVGEKA